MKINAKYINLVFILLLAICSEVSACDCGRALDEKNAEEYADIIFVGKLISKSKWSRKDENGQEDSGNMSHIIKNNFEVFQMQKGPNLTKIIVESGDGRIDCYAHPLDVGKIYKIYAADYADFADIQWGLSACGFAKEILIHEKQ